MPGSASAVPCAEPRARAVITSAPPATRSNTGSSRHSSAVASAVRSSAPSTWNLGSAATRSSATSSPPAIARNPASRSRTSVVCNRSRPVTLNGISAFALTAPPVHCDSCGFGRRRRNRATDVPRRLTKTHNLPRHEARFRSDIVHILESEPVEPDSARPSCGCAVAASAPSAHRPATRRWLSQDCVRITEYADRRMKSVERRFSAMVTRLTRSTPKVLRK